MSRAAGGCWAWWIPGVPDDLRMVLAAGGAVPGRARRLLIRRYHTSARTSADLTLALLAARLDDRVDI